MSRLLSVLFWLIALSLTAVITVVYTILDDTPVLVYPVPPSPADIAASEDFVRELGRVVEEGEGARPVAVSEVQANGILRVAGQMYPAARARVNVLESRVSVTAAIEIPWITGPRWLNLEALVPEFRDEARVDFLRVGGLDIAPDPVLWLARTGANLAVGNEAGDIFFQSLRGLEIVDETMMLDVSLDEAGRRGFLPSLYEAVRGVGSRADEAGAVSYAAAN